MKEIESIEKYIVYLICECGLSVTLHPMEKDSLIAFSSLMRFNTHDNLYCATVKSKRCGHERCLLQQRRVFEKINKQKEAFSGACHAGVFEYVYPLRDSDEIIGFISVSGYSTNQADGKISRLVKEFGYSESELREAYKSLKVQNGDMAKIDTLIYPLCHMLELAYRREEKHNVCESITSRIERYIRENFATDIKVEDICRRFGLSRSYFSHTFKREVGKGFREYLVDVRIENAKRLLALSGMNVTEVAFSVGFSDSNYFSNLFKKSVGITPLSYKKRARLP